MNRFKRSLAVLLTLALLITAFMATAISAGAVVADVMETGLDGIGTKDDPYLVYSLEDLVWIKKKVNSGKTFAGYFFKLMNDITMNEPDVFSYDEEGNVTGPAEGKRPYCWTPIGRVKLSDYDTNKPFSGTFDGAGHKIIGIYINSNEKYQGFFGYCDNASILNLGIVGGYIKGDRYIGGVVGCNSATGKTVTISNCYNTSAIVGNYYVGGVVGSCTAFTSGSITVTHSYNTGMIIGTSNTGGIVGAMDAYSGQGKTILSNCYNIGKISGKYFIGGIVGYSRIVSGEATITKSFNAGSINGIKGPTGGISGKAESITDCYNTADVNGDSDVGGIMGDGSGGSKIAFCYNTGEISGNAIIGTVTPNTRVNHCYHLLGTWKSAPHGGSTYPIFEACRQLSQEKMCLESSYDGFDFELVWTMEGNSEYLYPELIGMVHVDAPRICSHSYSDWVIDIKPRSDSEGSKYRVCELCGKTETEIIPAKGFICGDTDGDGDVTVLDATTIQRKLAGLDTPFFQDETADTDMDNKLTILDATFIQRWLASIATNDRIGNRIW